MVRSTAISWKIGVAVTAAALQLWQLPARADDGSTQGVGTRAEPLKPKSVPITLLPPASDAEMNSWRQYMPGGAPIVMVRPAKNGASAQPSPEQAQPAPTIVQPAVNAPSAQPRPEQAETAFIMMPPAASIATAQPRPEPEKTRDVTRAETSSLSAKPRRDAPLAAIPSIPGRSPFRPAPFKSEIVENRQEAPEPPKGSAASRFLSSLWRGNKGASTPVSATAEGRPLSLAEDKAGQAEAGSKSDTSPTKRFLDGIQFWKN